MKQEQIQYCIPENIRSGIYKICAPNGHFLVGSTNNFKLRWQDHFLLLKKNKHPNSRLQNTYNKYPKGWICEVLEKVSPVKELLLEREQNYIDIYFGSATCMNLNRRASAPPSQKGVKRAPRSKEYIEKLRNSTLKAVANGTHNSAKKLKPITIKFNDDKVYCFKSLTEAIKFGFSKAVLNKLTKKKIFVAQKNTVSTAKHSFTFKKGDVLKIINETPA